MVLSIELLTISSKLSLMVLSIELLTISSKLSLMVLSIELLTIISKLIDGVGIEDHGFAQEALTISQLVMNNFRNKQISMNDTRRHFKRLETPLPTFIPFKIYATVRSRKLIDPLFSLGI